MKIHFIAIGGSAMHNLALALDQKGYQISGSDDEIYEPSRSRLDKAGLLPPEMGWFTEKINSDLDLVILGMHARSDNPELIKAQELNIPVHSYPSFLSEESRKKNRIVIAGSHGKTTTTSMIMEALHKKDIEFDYLVGAQLESFDLMVKLSNAPKIVIEGDEYLSSPIDARPKFLHYRPHIAVLTGIAWDHINVFPSYEIYVDQFRLFLASIEAGGTLIYNQNDPTVVELVDHLDRKDLRIIPYDQVQLDEDRRIIGRAGELYNSSLVGAHNYQNMDAARIVTEILGVSEAVFFASMETFSGAAKRLQLLKQNISKKYIAYLDFAHAPSKVKATVTAIKDWYPDRKLYAFLELHTYSSLNREFLPLYSESLDKADYGVVYYNQHTLRMKKMPDLPPAVVKEAFNNESLIITNSTEEVRTMLKDIVKERAVILLMTSGNFQGLSMTSIV